MIAEAWFESADGLRALDTIRLRPGGEWPEVWSRTCAPYPKVFNQEAVFVSARAFRTYKATGDRIAGAPIYRELHP